MVLQNQEFPHPFIEVGMDPYLYKGNEKPPKYLIKEGYTNDAIFPCVFEKKTISKFVVLAIMLIT